jgi:hypothetical protein
MLEWIGMYRWWTSDTVTVSATITTMESESDRATESAWITDAICPGGVLHAMLAPNRATTKSTKREIRFMGDESL